MRPRECWPPLAAALGLSLLALAPAGAGDYAEEIATWRAEREARLRSPDGWLTLVGLSWLREGENPFGSDRRAAVVLPGAGVPARAGVLRLAGRRVSVEAAPGVELLHEGRPVDRLDLASDQTGEPTTLTLGSLSFFVIERGERVGVRVKDRAAPALAEFRGLDAFPVDPRWRLAARFERADPPREVLVPNVLGEPTREASPGDVVLTVGGQPVRLQALGDPEEELFLVFGDRTNGHETYGGGRFLTADPPGPDGAVAIDFNRAYNPPCVFTPYATCPLPPPGNKLKVRVEAGEKMYGRGH